MPYCTFFSYWVELLSQQHFISRLKLTCPTAISSQLTFPLVSEQSNWGILLHNEGRADIEGSKRNVARNAWLPQTSSLCDKFTGILALNSQVLKNRRPCFWSAFTLQIKIKIKRAFALREVSVLAELALRHLRSSLTDVPLQSNSPPDRVFRANRVPTEAGRAKG